MKISNFKFQIHDQSGSSFVFLIILAIIVFSVLIVGGTFNIGGKESTFRTLTPTPPLAIQPTTPPKSDKPTPTATPSVQWSITHEFLGCKSGDERNVKIIVKGPLNGYVNIEIELTPGIFDTTATSKFTPTSGQYKATLSNNEGFNTKNWRVSIFSGGTENNGQWSGGELKSTSNGTPTGC